MANGTTNPTYSQALQNILGQPQTPGVFGYGFSKDDINQLQQAGITPQQLMQMGLSTQPQTTASAYQSGGGGGPTTSPSAGGIQQSNNAAMLGAMLKLGGGQRQQQTGPPAPPSEYGTDYPLYATDEQGLLTGKPVAYAGAQNQASLLGAAALQSPLVINQVPSAALDPRSGVSKVGGALVGSNVPQAGVTWDQLAAQRPYLTPDKIAALQQSGLTANQAAGGVGVKVPLAGPWTTQPGIFTQAQRTAPTMALGATPLQAAVQPTATAYNPTPTPFAQAPPAPGVTMPPPTVLAPLLAAHTSGLVDAGKAIFAHFGGDPNSATHADIAQFHRELQGAAAGGPPIKMRSGGVVPGRGNEDTVPALLTPGEYVIPKDQVAQFFGGRTPVKMASGGYPNDDDKQPPETRRQTLSVPTPPTQPSQPSSAPAAPGAGHSSLLSGITQAAQAYNKSFSGGVRGGYSADTLGNLGDEGLIGSMGLGKGFGGGAGSGQPTANALSGIASGLGQVAAGIQASAQPWQMQQNAIPSPDDFQRPPAITFAPQRVT